MASLLHTETPPNTRDYIVVFDPWLAGADQTTAMTLAGYCVRVDQARFFTHASLAQSLASWWNSAVRPASDPGVMWCYVTDLPALLTQVLNPPAPAQSADLALAAANLKLQAAITTLRVAATSAAASLNTAVAQSS